MDFDDDFVDIPEQHQHLKQRSILEFLPESYDLEVAKLLSKSLVPINKRKRKKSDDSSVLAVKDANEEIMKRATDLILQDSCSINFHKYPLSLKSSRFQETVELWSISMQSQTENEK